MNRMLIDLTKISSASLVKLRRNMLKMQRWGGGYQTMIGEIDAELAKENRPADAKREREPETNQR